MTSSSDATELLPLGTPVFHILLALGHDTLHGYGIMRAIEEKTDGTVRILPGTLYTTLSRMVGDGLLEDAPRPDDEPDDERRRRYYRATELGHEAVAAEAERMALLVDLARREPGLP